MSSRMLVIGDVHGCLSQLDAILAAVDATSEDHFVFLGDLVDRGPDSAGVLKRVISLTRAYQVTTIKGNHEQMMLDARGGLSFQRDWVLNGGDDALASYAGNRATLRDVPSEHWRFLDESMVDYVETDTHIFVHANAYPDHPMDEQPDFMLRWERCDDIRPHQSGKIIVCGHTPQKGGRPMNRGFAVCIDTGAGHGGLLTCLDVTSGHLWQADKKGNITRAHISDFRAVALEDGEN